MKKHIIWSNIDLNVEDWRDGYKEYLEMNEMDDADPNDEDAIYEWMNKTNDMYFDDEYANLNKELDGRILVIADLGLWNGRKQGYKILGKNIHDILFAHIQNLCAFSGNQFHQIFQFQHTQSFSYGCTAYAQFFCQLIFHQSFTGNQFACQDGVSQCVENNISQGQVFVCIDIEFCISHFVFLLSTLSAHGRFLSLPLLSVQTLSLPEPLLFLPFPRL